VQNAHYSESRFGIGIGKYTYPIEQLRIVSNATSVTLLQPMQFVQEKDLITFERLFKDIQCP